MTLILVSRLLLTFCNFFYPFSPPRHIIY
ncbi:MAG TPA: hypothetical protein DCM40_21780 [Maribacter sp.]|nr:hypothetical protein [Maribacter sp.]